jgi:hypothetical protein
MDALIKAMEARGFVVKIVRNEKELRTYVTVFGESTCLRLRERYKRLPHELTESERTYPHVLWTRKWDLVHSGRLELSIMRTFRDWGTGTSPIRIWVDTDRRQVEDVLGEFVIWLLEWADDRKAERARQEQEQREHDELERQRIAEEARRKREEERVKGLIDDAESWDRSRRLRAYLRAVRQREQRRGRIDPGSELGKWFAWARDVAAQMDPLLRDSIEQIAPEEEPTREAPSHLTSYPDRERW